MRRRQREIGSFSVAAVDLFASGMGIFLVMVIVLFPYYKKNHDVVREVRELERALSAAESEADAARKAAASAKAEAEEVRRATTGPMRIPDDSGERNLEFARGCWETAPFRHSPSHEPGVSQYCFDASGRGNLIFMRSNGEVCAALATIRRDGERIRISDTDSRCGLGQLDVGPWFADHLVCVPDADGVVACTGTSDHAGEPHTWTVQLHRR